MVPTVSKPQNIYYYKEIIENNNSKKIFLIKLCLILKKFNKCYKKNLPDTIINGCFFNYIKLLWNKDNIKIQNYWF